MRQKLYNFTTRSIKLFFYFLFTLAFIFALTSPNLILGDNHINGIGTTIVTTVILIIAFVIGLTLYISPGAQLFAHRVFVEQRWHTATYCFLLAIFAQAFLITFIHPAIGFDTSAVHNAIRNPNTIANIGYFSVNPNNLDLLLIQHWVAQQFHQTSWLFFDIVTTFLVDLSAVLNILSIAAINKDRVPTGLYIHALWLVCFPSILVPYTDTWALPFVSAYLLCYCVTAYSTAPKLLKGITALLFGIFAVAAYFIKPSSLIPVIAIAIIEVIHLLLYPRKHQWWWIMLLAIFFVGSTAGSYHVEQQIVKNQTLIRIYSFRAKPMVHFINMGLSGHGGYNAHDSLVMVSTMSKKKRIAYSENSIKKRLKKMGPTGYLKFLFMKHRYNTADSSFGWAMQDDALVGNPPPTKKPGIRRTIQEFIYLYGNNLGDFRFMTQIWWVLGLGLILFAWRDNRKVLQVLRLAILGGFLFLLGFEGGRTRYLIQFLPVFLLLATLGFTAATQEFKHWFGWMGAASRPDKSSSSAPTSTKKPLESK